MLYWGIAIGLLGYLLLALSRRTSIQHPHFATLGATLMIAGGTAAILGSVFWAFE